MTESNCHACINKTGVCVHDFTDLENVQKLSRISAMIAYTYVFQLEAGLCTHDDSKGRK